MYDGKWPNESDCGDVVLVLSMLFLMVVMVVICVGCDGGSHGEVLLLFVLVAEWNGVGGVMSLVV